MRSGKTKFDNRFMTVVAAAAVIGVVGAGAGFAAGTIGSDDIKDNSVKSKDIKDGTIKLKDIKDKDEAKLKGQTGPAGPAGPAQTNVASLGGTWTATEDDCGAGGGADTGNVEVAGGSLRFDSINDGNARARVDYAPLVGKTLADLASLEYSAKYTQTGTDIHQGLPYFIVKVANGSNVDSIVFTPGTQPAPVTPSQSGIWQRFSVTEGTARFNDDEGANADVPWQDIIRDHGTQAIVRAGIQAGCAGTAINTVALVDNVVIDVAGEKSEFDFGG